MNVNLLAINIGNTRSHIGSFVLNQLEAEYHVNNDQPAELAALLLKAFDPLDDADDVAVYISSVNKEMAIAMTESVRNTLGVEPLRVEQDVNIPIGRKLDPQSIIGEDRLLNAAAAFDQFSQACAIIDAGTAVTVDFVDGEGTFHGGAILPGAQMMLNAMHQQTDQLPELIFTKPDEAIGHSTQQAMLDGVYHGIRGACRELIEMYAIEYGGYPRIIATGGNAHLLFDEYELIETIDDNLTLKGMMVTHQQALKQQMQSGD